MTTQSRLIPTLNATHGLVAAGVLAVGFSISANVAFATETRAAIRMCEAHPNCEFWMNDDGSFYIVVDSDDVIECPPSGECECVDCDPPARVGSTASKKIFGPSAVSKILK